MDLSFVHLSALKYDSFEPLAARIGRQVSYAPRNEGGSLSPNLELEGRSKEVAHNNRKTLDLGVRVLGLTSHPYQHLLP